MTTIHGEYGHLLTKVEESASCQFAWACSMIDRQFGEGYAAQHPELVARIVTSMAIDYARATFAKVVGEFVDAYREGTDRLTSQ